MLLLFKILITLALWQGYSCVIPSYARDLSTKFEISHSVRNDSQIVSFDLDETLIASDKLLNTDIENAKKLGYKVKTSVNGQDYIIRPGVIELLDFVQSQGFEMIIFTHNTKDYATDILESSGLADYFSTIKAHEDVVKTYNKDFQTYPNHRNKTYPQQSPLEVYTNGLYQGLLLRGFQNMQGNKNIKPYVPCMNCAKYPPVYGSRVHIDNSSYNIENPVDFVGIEVEDFYGKKIIQPSSSGAYGWVEKLKADIVFLKENGWVELYKKKYNKAPDDSEVRRVYGRFAK